MRSKIFLVLLLVLAGCEPHSARQVSSKTEVWYVEQLAAQNGWQSEVTTSIGTRCDLLTDKLAIEVDWPNKTFEAIGQSLHYAEQLDREPGIIFLVRNAGDREYIIKRVGNISANCGIKLFWCDTKTLTLDAQH